MLVWHLHTLNVCWASNSKCIVLLPLASPPPSPSPPPLSPPKVHHNHPMHWWRQTNYQKTLLKDENNLPTVNLNWHILLSKSLVCTGWLLLPECIAKSIIPDHCPVFCHLQADGCGGEAIVQIKPNKLNNTTNTAHLLKTDGMGRWTN